MNKRLHDQKGKNEKQEKNPREQRLHFILLRVLLFLACVAVSVGIWLAVHYVEHLEEGEHEQNGAPSASYTIDDCCSVL